MANPLLDELLPAASGHRSYPLSIESQAKGFLIVFQRNDFSPVHVIVEEQPHVPARDGSGGRLVYFISGEFGLVFKGVPVHLLQ